MTSALLACLQRPLTPAAEHKVTGSLCSLELGYDIGGELFEVLEELLDKAGQEHYAGAHPPQKSYKDNIHGLDLYTFRIESPGFGCKVYLKFVLAMESLWLVSLHKDRPYKDSI